MVRPLLWFKIEREERTNSSFAETCPLFFGVSLLCSHTFFQGFSFSVSGIFFRSFFDRRELLVNLLNESYCCRTSCKHPLKIVSLLLYKNGTNYCTIQQLLFVRDKINQVCLLVREVDVHYEYSWYVFGLRMYAMTTVSPIFFHVIFCSPNKYCACHTAAVRKLGESCTHCIEHPLVFLRERYRFFLPGGHARNGVCRGSKEGAAACHPRHDPVLRDRRQGQTVGGGINFS